VLQANAACAARSSSATARPRWRAHTSLNAALRRQIHGDMEHPSGSRAGPVQE
jgi:hypothetical protein